MFVKVINHDEKEAIQKGAPKTHCFDVNSFIIEKAPDEFDGDIMIVFDHNATGMEAESPWTKIISFPKQNHTIIVMNNNGKTVDKYTW